VYHVNKKNTHFSRGRMRKVESYKLRPLHHGQGDLFVRLVLVRDQGDTDFSGSWQWCRPAQSFAQLVQAFSGHNTVLKTAPKITQFQNTVCVLGSQHALVGGQGLSPAGMAGVVAGAVDGSEGRRRVALGLNVAVVLERCGFQTERIHQVSAPSFLQVESAKLKG